MYSSDSSNVRGTLTSEDKVGVNEFNGSVEEVED